MLTIKHVENANKDYFLCQQNILTSYILFDLRPYFCLGSLEIRKIGISFIIGYHTLNQLKEMPYVQTSTSQIFRRSKNESSLGSRPGWSPSIPGL